MPLTFDERGLLPPGVHPATWDEVRDAFGRFQRTDRRIKLLERLQSYGEELRRAGVGQALVIDGSFILRAVDEPNDIDLILIFPPGWDESADLLPHQYNLVSKMRVRREFGFDVFGVSQGTEEERSWLSFFSNGGVRWGNHFGWPLDLQKGLVKVSL